MYIATRSAYEAGEAIDELRPDTGRDHIFFLELNLADLDSVKAAADCFFQKELELHALYNNQ